MIFQMSLKNTPVYSIPQLTIKIVALCGGVKVKVQSMVEIEFVFKAEVKMRDILQ